MVDYIKTKYPLVFVHGMFGWGENEGINKYAPYWGTTVGSLKKYLADNEIESYEASVGPVSSAWDQACELYAQLKGTRVDYGEFHSQKYSHRRFGRVYEKPLFDNWGEEKKIHLIGHSFGGNAVRLLVHLLKYGAPEEVKLSGENVSDLFKGGQENFVCSLTTLCTPLNGTDAHKTARHYKLVAPVKFICFSYAVLMSRTKLQGSLVDFHLEQFGVNDTPGKKDKISFIPALKSLLNTKDIVEYDMSEEGSKHLNKIIKTVPTVYYFSYVFNGVKTNGRGKAKLENIRFWLLKATASLMLRNSKSQGKSSAGVDGLVDVESAMYPETEPYSFYEGNGNFKKGEWNVMPLKTGDHGTPIGLFADKEATRRLYDNIVYILSACEFCSGTQLV